MSVDPKAANPSFAAFARVRHYGDKLFDALQELDEAGGSAQAVLGQGWQPKVQHAALASLKATRDALDVEIKRMERRHQSYKPGPKGRRPSKPGAGPVQVKRKAE